MIMRLARLRRRERRLLIMALVAMSRARLLIRFAAFPRAIAFGNVALGPPSSVSVESVIWTIHAACRLPFRTACFEQGLAAQRILRRHGHDARLHYGISPAEDVLEAHVWLSLGGTIILGGEPASRFGEVGRWP